MVIGFKGELEGLYEDEVKRLLLEAMLGVRLWKRVCGEQHTDVVGKDPLGIPVWVVIGSHAGQVSLNQPRKMFPAMIAIRVLCHHLPATWRCVACVRRSWILCEIGNISIFEDFGSFI